MPGVLEQEEFLLEPGPSIQQPVAFAHPVPERLDVFSIFCGGNATPDVGQALGRKSGQRGISRSLQHVIFCVDEKEVRDLATAQRAPRTTGAGRDRDQEHLANERTLLSWVRTGVSLISIGLVVERAAALVDASMKVGSTSASEFLGWRWPARGAHAHHRYHPIPQQPAQDLDRRVRPFSGGLPDNCRR